MGRVIRVLVMVGVALGLTMGMATAGTKEVIIRPPSPRSCSRTTRRPSRPSASRLLKKAHHLSALPALRQRMGCDARMKYGSRLASGPI
jgi:hypothetical protein